MMTAIGLFTAFHTALSIIALLSGIVTIRKLLQKSFLSVSVNVFLMTAIATSVTGFFFPFHGMTPAIGVGVVATCVLAWTLFARRMVKRSASWTSHYAIGLVVSEYLLVFVAIAQAFTKIPALHALAPTLKEPPFGSAQLLALLIFIFLAFVVARRSRLRAEP